MARTFASASSQRLDAGSISWLNGASAFTIVFSYKRTSSNSHACGVGQGQSGTLRNGVYPFTDGNLYVSAGAGLSYFSDANQLLHRIAFRFDGSQPNSATKAVVFQDGIQKSLNNSVVFSATASTGTGIWYIGYDQPNGVYSNATISDVGVWDVPLPDDALAFLSGIGTCLYYRRGLRHYWPLSGRGGSSANEEDWIAGTTATAINSPAVGTEFRLQYPPRRRFYLLPSVSGDLTETLGSVGATAGVTSLTADATSDASDTLTGVSATSGVNDLTVEVTGDALSETLTGVGSTSGVNDLTAVSTDVLTETLTGVGSTAGVSSVTANADTADTVTLVEAGATAGVSDLTAVSTDVLTETLTGVGSTAGVADLGTSTGDDETLSGVGTSTGVSDLTVNVTEEGAEVLGSVGATAGVSSLTIDLQQDAEVTLIGVGATAGVNDLIIPREEPLLDEEIAAALGPLVKGSVYPLRRPQRETAEIARAHLPEIVYTIVSDDWEQAETLCGVGLHATRVQIDVYANHYREARGYAYAVAREMDALGWRINMQPFPDDDEKIYRWQLEYSCWRNEAPPDIPVPRTKRR